ncbi:MAG TPA: hypothetical protein VGG45_07560 [Terracidiphilus sp.]|jgi:hypothetical protein
MAKPFHELRERLLRAGVAPRHVRRYLGELQEHVADLKAEEERHGLSAADAEQAALARLGNMDDLAVAMIGKRQFQSWSARAPWVAFCIAPLLCLAAAWGLALFILASGWAIFLPQAETPFNVPVHGFAMLYFGLGKLIYFDAPLAIGWGIGIIATRGRSKPIWPLAGLVPLAWFGGMAQVHASRIITSGAIDHISVTFSRRIQDPGMSGSLIQASAILLATALPYLVWRMQKAFSKAA